MDKIRICDFKQYCKENFKIFLALKQIEDKRKKPQIKIENMAWAIISAVSMGIRSLLELDQIGRLKSMRNYTGSKRSLVCSDTSYERILKLISLTSLRNLSKKLYRHIQNQGLDKLKLKSGRILKAASVDGSGFGRHLASVVSILGKTETGLDAEVYAQKGKELPSSYMLIKRLTKALGKNWTDVIVADGLYKAKEFFGLCKDSGFDAVIKTEEVRLELIHDASGLFKDKNNPAIERESGFDQDSPCDYTIEAVGQIEMNGLEYTVKVAHITEHYTKPQPKAEEFFVITTKEDLSVSELRELAHIRWRIENNVFRQLNQLIRSKSVHTHNQRVLSSLLLLWYMGPNLLKVFLHQISIQNFRMIYATAKKTILICVSHLRLSLTAFASEYG